MPETHLKTTLCKRQKLNFGILLHIHFIRSSVQTRCYSYFLEKRHRFVPNELSFRSLLLLLGFVKVHILNKNYLKQNINKSVVKK